MRFAFVALLVLATGCSAGSKNAAGGDADAALVDGSSQGSTANGGGDADGAQVVNELDGSGASQGAQDGSLTDDASTPTDAGPPRGPFDRLAHSAKGVAYDGFPVANAMLECGYDPSSSSNTLTYFGSDAAAKHMGALWGDQSHVSASCGTDCRDDLGKMAALGVNLIRLYDWDPRNDHHDFLDRCAALGIGVLVPISNWFLANDLANAEKTSATLLGAGNFGNAAETDYHEAVAGVLIGNEVVLSGLTLDAAITYTRGFVAAEAKRGYRPIALGHPTEFVPRGAPLYQGKNMPAWSAFDTLLTALPELSERLMLCPNSYNDAAYLFDDAENTGEGYVPLTTAQFSLPILFTEIGQDRTKPNYANIVQGQLQGVLDYAAAHPLELLGSTVFQFVDKAWMPGTSEGSFGMYSHGAVVRTLELETADFTHFDVAEPGCLNIDALVETPIFDAVKAAYHP